MQVTAEQGRGAALLLGRRGDRGELLASRTALLVDTRQCGGDIGIARQAFLHQHITLLHGADGVAGFLLDALDHHGNLVRGLTGARSQVAHLIGHHGKATPLLTGTRRFDRSIKRQQVGLFGDRGDDANDAADFLGALAQSVDHRRGAVQCTGDLLQGRGRFVHRRATDPGLLGVFLGQALGVAHVVGDVQGGGAELFHGPGHAGDLARLLLHPFIGTARQTGQGLGAAVDLHRGVANVLDHGRQRLTHLVKRTSQLADFIVARHA